MTVSPAPDPTALAAAEARYTAAVMHLVAELATGVAYEVSRAFPDAATIEVEPVHGDDDSPALRLVEVYTSTCFPLGTASPSTFAALATHVATDLARIRQMTVDQDAWSTRIVLDLDHPRGWYCDKADDWPWPT